MNYHSLIFTLFYSFAHQQLPLLVIYNITGCDGKADLNFEYIKDIDHVRSILKHTDTTQCFMADCLFF